MKTGWGILGVAALAASLPLAGCSTACSTIGYVSTIEVMVEGEMEAVHQVQLCTDEGCSEPEPAADPAPSIAVSEPMIPLPSGGFSPAPGPSIPPPTYPDAPYLSYRKNGTWIIYAATGNRSPATVTLRALAEDGTVLDEQENNLEWTRTGGTAQCGGPVTTPPIVFMVGER